MSVSIISRPILGSYKYVAAHNPVVYSVSCACDAIDRPKYYIEFEIREVASDKILGKLKVKPSLLTEILTAGVVTAYSSIFTLDVSSIVKQYLKNDFVTPSGENIKSSGNLFFFITYREYVGTTLFQTFTDEANPVTAINGALQFENGDSRYVGYTPQKTGAPLAKFLTKFKEPTRYAGYPFSISFIYSNELAGAQIIRVDQELDINRVQNSNTETQLDTVHRNGVNNMKTKATFAGTAAYDRLFLKVGTAVTDGYVDSGYVDTGYTI